MLCLVHAFQGHVQASIHFLIQIMLACPRPLLIIELVPSPSLDILEKIVQTFFLVVGNSFNGVRLRGIGVSIQESVWQLSCCSGTMAVRYHVSVLIIKRQIMVSSFCSCRHCFVASVFCFVPGCFDVLFCVMLFSLWAGGVHLKYNDMMDVWSSWSLPIIFHNWHLCC